jgi:hypothetical protein
MERVPYICDKRYDGLPFLTYPERINKISALPISSAGLLQGVSYTKVTRDPPAAEQEQLYQTWLFFGLLAEFMGLNSAREDQQPPSNQLSTRNEETLDKLYHDYIFEEEGKQYLSTAKILQGDGILSISASGQDPGEAQLKHLQDCLRVCHGMLRFVQRDFNPGTKYCIAALGEFLTGRVSRALQRGIQRPYLQTLGIPTWATNFLDSSNIQKCMINAGWCPSDIQRVRSRYESLQTVHLCSMIDRRVPGRNHEECDIHACNAYQIDDSTYSVGHVKTDCKCNEFHVDIDAVINALETESYPILMIDPHCTDHQNLKIDVKQCIPGSKYVAISHVCSIRRNAASKFSQIFRFGQMGWAIHEQTRFSHVYATLLSPF